MTVTSTAKRRRKQAKKSKTHRPRAKAAVESRNAFQPAQKKGRR